MKYIESYSETVKEMYDIVEKFYKDLEPYKNWTLLGFFWFLCFIPYREDLEIEVIGRPRLLLERAYKGLDCKKKSILMACYLKNKDIPYRFKVVGQGDDVHHIFVEGFLKEYGGWIDLDCTYSGGEIGKKEDYKTVVYE